AHKPPVSSFCCVYLPVFSCPLKKEGSRKTLFQKTFCDTPFLLHAFRAGTAVLVIVELVAAGRADFA
ncbi:hypothetical protein, partial [Sporomusa sphaeroides]|uniref:hypothetical protein n=1 Tax=Sporomusa sphaeroides TaxID=47679 RepID=UPI003158C6E0